MYIEVKFVSEHEIYFEYFSGADQEKKSTLINLRDLGVDVE